MQPGMADFVAAWRLCDHEITIALTVSALKPLEELLDSGAKLHTTSTSRWDH